MIICFEGRPGSGKSYEAVRKIIDNLRLGRTVYTNIDGFDDPVKRESIKSYCGLDDYELETRLIYLPYHLLHEFWDHVKTGSLIVIDEAHKYFSNRDWQKSSNQEFANWASTHRHYGYDVLLLTQNIGKIDAHVRGLVEWTYRYTKLNMFGSVVQHKYKRESYLGDDITSQPLDRSYYTYDSRIFACYKSFVSQDIKELGIMKHVNILRHPVFFLIPLAFIVSLFFISKSSLFTGDLFGTKKKGHSVHNTVKPSVVNVSDIPIKPSNPALVESPIKPSNPVIVESPKIASNPVSNTPKSSSHVAYPPVPLKDVFPVPSPVSDMRDNRDDAPVYIGMSGGKKTYKDKDGRVYVE